MRLMCGLLNKREGFTLIEVLVAVTILAIVVTGLYSSLFPVLKVQAVVERQVEMGREVRRFLDTLSTEIRSLYFAAGDEYTFFSGTLGEYEGSALGEVSFTSFSYSVIRKGRPSSDLYEIRYYLEGDHASNENDEDSSSSVTYVLKKDIGSPFIEGSGLMGLEVIGNVTAFELEYYDGKEWLRYWDSSEFRKLPKAVRASLTITDGGTESVYRLLARPALS